jgi:hypothetical protein
LPGEEANGLPGVTMETILILLGLIGAFALFYIAATRFGVDTRPSIGDDHHG